MKKIIISMATPSEVFFPYKFQVDKRNKKQQSAFDRAMCHPILFFRGENYTRLCLDRLFHVIITLHVVDIHWDFSGSRSFCIKMCSCTVLFITIFQKY